MATGRGLALIHWRALWVDENKRPLIQKGFLFSAITVCKDHWEYKTQVKDTFSPHQPVGRWEWENKPREVLDEVQGILTRCDLVWEDQTTMWTLAGTVHCLLAAALLSLSCLQSVTTTEDDVTPRISFPYSELKQSHEHFYLVEIIAHISWSPVFAASVVEVYCSLATVTAVDGFFL